jgi:hypothetical protein
MAQSSQRMPPSSSGVDSPPTLPSSSSSSVGPSPGAVPSGLGASSSESSGPTGGQMGGAGEWMAHVKRTMRANPGKKLKDVLKLAKKTYKKGTAKKTARKSRKGSRKSKSWFMGGSSAIVAAGYSPGGTTGGSRHRSRGSRGRKH